MGQTIRIRDRTGCAGPSGGGKSTIGRVILNESPIVILDEAIGAPDAENEHEIFGDMDVLAKNKTVIMIAPKIKSAEKADHIIAPKDGSVGLSPRFSYPMGE